MKSRILIVEDEQSTRTFLRKVLEKEYVVVEAIDGYDALSRVFESIKVEQPIDLVITDLSMPNLNGVDFVENLLEEIPLIIISGYVDRFMSRQLGRLRPVEVLYKPFSIAELLAAVKKAIG